MTNVQCRFDCRICTIQETSPSVTLTDVLVHIQGAWYRVYDTGYRVQGIGYSVNT